MASQSLPNFNHHLIPSLVDEAAKSDPDRVFYSAHKTKNPADGFRDIDARSFARAVDSCAWNIEKNLGKGQDFPTLVYIGPQDILYPILILATIKTGYKLLLSSPRNSLEAHMSLLERTNCNTFLLAQNFPLPVIKQILGERQMRTLDIAGWEHWIDHDEGEYVPYPYNKTWEQAEFEPFVVLHTSGSTGLPKPIVIKHGSFAYGEAYAILAAQGPTNTTFDHCCGTRMYCAFPMFHMAGVAVLLPYCLYTGITMVTGPFPPTGDILNSMILHGNIKNVSCAPMTIIDLVRNPDYVENLGRLDHLIFGGGPLPQAVGDLVATKTKLSNTMGSTETAPQAMLEKDQQDWAYIKVSPLTGHEFRYVSEDLYEQVIVRDPKLESFQAVFKTFPELNEYHTKDLFSKHPTKEDLWIFRGRLDDIIVYSTGEKLNPVDMENTITTNPAVNAVLIGGQGQFQSCMLVEAVKPPTTEGEKGELLDAIWPSVQVANKNCPSHGVVQREMIIFTLPDKPMIRAGKGTVQRRATFSLYQEEIDALYAERPGGLNGTTEDAEIPTDLSPNGIESLIKRIMAEVSGLNIQELDHGTDLFEMGLDSLQVTVLTKFLNKALQSQQSDQRVESKIVYGNPTIASLSAALKTLSTGNTRAETDEQKMQRLYNLCAEDMPITTRDVKAKSETGDTILLTGSTGSLGSYLLDSLIQDPSVANIYCLNRGKGSLERQRQSHQQRGLTTAFGKVKFLEGADFSKSHFGLSRPQMRKLLSKVTTIIHNAWKVDFNQSLDSFSGHIRGVRRMIDFSAHSTFGAKVLFISSVSAVRDATVLEKVYEDWGTPLAMGYGQSKFISERLLDTAAKEANVPAVICRVGQVAGPTTEQGIWPKQEWLPSLVQSSKLMGKLPNSLGLMDVVDWIPVDTLGKVIVELANGTTPHAANDGALTYNLANPKVTTWEKLLPTVNNHLGQRKDIQLVPLKGWVDALRKIESSGESAAKNPGIKLLDFYQDLASNVATEAPMNVKGSIDISPTMANLGSVQNAWMENWMRQWDA